MRFAVVILTFVLGCTFGNGAARAFDCIGVTLPSSIVICSDPELMRLADERQEAINETRGRIGEEAWPVLWENQQAWVRSYAPAWRRTGFGLCQPLIPLHTRLLSQRRDLRSRLLRH
jgi:hypothetical protein